MTKSRSTIYPTDLHAPGAIDALLAAHRETFGGFRMETFDIPEDVTSVEDLEAAVTAAMAEAESINVEDASDDDLDRLDALAAFCEAAREEATRREGEAEERRTRAEAARARLRGDTDETEGEQGDQEQGEGEESPEGADESDAEQGDGEGESQDQPEGEQAPEAVAAGAAVRRRRAPSLIRRVRQPENPAPAGQASDGVTITAAAGIRDVEAGSRLPDLDALTRAFTQRLGGFPASKIPNQYIKSPVATLSTGGWGDLDQANRGAYEDDQQLVAAAGNENRSEIVAAGGLVAAGWCAPSETLYDFMTPFTTDGLFDVPEVRVTRGGLNTTIGPDFAALWADADSGFAQTEAQAEAGNTKPCIMVDCPDFDEVRLDAVGYCVKAGILTEVAYPELIRDFLAGVAVGHQFRMSARTITSIVALLPAARTLTASGSAARSVLTGLELAAEGERQRYALGENETLEVVLPHWVRVVLRDDFSSRNGLEATDGRVTDALLDAHFADRKLRVQWVRGWQPLTTSVGVIDFPDAVTAIMYPAGTFVRGRQDVISLDAVYDTTDLSTNVYTAAFFEEAMLVLRRGYGGLNLRIPLVSKGSTGPLDLVAYGTTDA